MMPTPAHPHYIPAPDTSDASSPTRASRALIERRARNRYSVDPAWDLTPDEYETKVLWPLSPAYADRLRKIAFWRSIALLIAAAANMLRLVSSDDTTRLACSIVFWVFAAITLGCLLLGVRSNMKRHKINENYQPDPTTPPLAYEPLNTTQREHFDRLADTAATHRHGTPERRTALADLYAFTQNAHNSNTPPQST